ncbi:MAG: hypothetical protein ACRED9_05850 [Caulobacteraceae bacterium]
MLFLLNETVLDLSSCGLSLSAAAHRYRRLDLEFVGRLGAELYAEDPRLETREPERAARLAVMIAAVEPRINAAQFLAPCPGCSLSEVASRFEAVPQALLNEILGGRKSGELEAWAADRKVWRRLAA